MPGAQAPYYLGITINETLFSASNSNSCKRDQPKITMGDFQGKDSCLTVPRYPLVPLTQIPVDIHSTLVPGTPAEYISRPQRLFGLLALSLNQVHIF